MILTGYIIIYSYLAFILLLTHMLNQKFKVKEIITRKFVHIMVSFVWFLFYIYFGTSYHIMIIPFTFIILNYISYKKNLLKGVEIENSLGTIYYPTSVLILAIITYFNPEFYPAFAMGWFCMGLGDGFAPLAAGLLKSHQIINNKTITGTLAVLLISFAIAYVANYYFKLDYNFFKLTIIGLSASLLELVGIKGLDNIYLPLGVSLIVYLLGVI